MAGRVGEFISAQLAISSRAHKVSAPIPLAEILVTFEGGLKAVKIGHETEDRAVATPTAGAVVLYDVSFVNSSDDPNATSTTLQPCALPTLFGTADLVFPPGITKVFTFSMLPRAAGDIRASLALLSLRQELFDADISIPLIEAPSRADWWYRNDTAVLRRKLDVDHPCIMTIQPRPPKLQIVLPSLRKLYYTNEQVEIQLQFTNEEEEIADVRVHVRLLGTAEKVPTIFWVTDIKREDQESSDNVTFASGCQLEDIPLGLLRPSETVQKVVTFQALPEMSENVIEISAHYHLSTDPDTPISKTMRKGLIFIAPFEANYDFVPSVDSHPWPSYFQVRNDEPISNPSPEDLDADGLRQRWSVATKLASFAVEPLVVETMSLKLLGPQYGAKCELTFAAPAYEGGTVLSPNEVLDHTFGLAIQKLRLDDRRSSSLTFHLNVLWHREDTVSTKISTALLLPPFTIPFGEPRVLATAHSTPTSPLIHVAYTLENPSVHLLTFSLTMEASEEFAFSGPKAITLQLLPLSRHVVGYNFLPTRKGVWIRPVLKVVDVGFGKRLRVGAADGCRGDKKGVAIWVGDTLADGSG